MAHLFIFSSISLVQGDFKNIYIYFTDFTQGGRERESWRHRSPASCTRPTGDVPATQVHANDQNRTWDPSLFTEPNWLGRDFLFLFFNMSKSNVRESTNVFF